MSNSKCHRTWICGHFQITRVIQAKKRTTHPWTFLVQPKPDHFYFSWLPSLILKYFCSFKPHGEVAFWLILMETSQERVFSADFQIQEIPWSILKIPWYLAVFQPTSELWGQMAITMIFLQPQRAQTKVCKPSRLSNTFFEKMADATNPVGSLSSELFLWHTQKLDAWQRKSMCSSQPSRKINQTAAAGPFVLLGVKMCGSLLSTSKTHQCH